MIIYYLGIGFTIWMAVEAARRGQAMPWLWIILFFPGVGPAVYFFAEYLSSNPLRFRLSSGRVSKRELDHAELEVRRLDNSEAWTNYAHALRSRKRYLEAVEAASKGLDRDESNLRARYELGLAQIGAESYADAAFSLSQLVEVAPNHDSGEAQYALAIARQNSGDNDSARRTLETLAKTTSLPKVLYRLASLQAEAGLTDGARESLQRIIDEAEYVPKYHRREVRPWVRKARKSLASLPVR